MHNGAAIAAGTDYLIGLGESDVAPDADIGESCLGGYLPDCDQSANLKKSFLWA